MKKTKQQILQLPLNNGFSMGITSNLDLKKLSFEPNSIQMATQNRRKKPNRIIIQPISLVMN